MTTWAELQSYVRGNYKVVAETDAQLAVLFQFDSGRTQQASITLERMVDHDWVCISSAFGAVGEVDVTKALEMLDARIFGAIGRDGEVYVVKHSALLADMDGKELEYPLLLTLAVAEELESKVSLGDKF